MRSARRGQVQAHIDAPPQKVWALLADLEQMGRWSPECYRVRWLDGASSPATEGPRRQALTRAGLRIWRPHTVFTRPERRLQGTRVRMAYAWTAQSPGLLARAAGPRSRKAIMAWSALGTEGRVTMPSIMLSMPVRNLVVSRAFFAELGFMFSPELSGPGSACVVISEDVWVRLLAEDRFRDEINGDVGCCGSAREVLVCLPASSERAVDEMVMRAIVAGGKPWPVLDERPVYSGAFVDPDGHLWQVACPLDHARQEPARPAAQVPA